MLKSIELFAGAGGLGMGVSLAGFESCAVVERDRWACDTLNENIDAENPLVRGWPLFRGDVRNVDFQPFEGEVDLVAGGPPCQPFSLGGKHRAYNDDRDMFPATVDIIRVVRPKAFIVENVRGLTRQSFANYFQYIVLQLTFPEIARRGNEEWPDHLGRLEKIKTAKERRGLTYRVVTKVLNAADFGVPQKRDRVFFVGFRSDIDAKWQFPNPTHCFDALLETQWVNGEYWEHHQISKSKRPSPPERYRNKISQIKSANLRPTLQLKPWRTVRDALKGVPDPRLPSADELFENHHFQPGAKPYPGHTGSQMDLPAKALKAGDHGVPGGENMMVLDDGNCRYFSVREAARIQTFPDTYKFHGSWTETMRQLGNAVPVRLAEVVASSVAAKLIESDEREFAKVIRRIAG